MDDVGLLLKAYWEKLHELLAENKDLVAEKIDVLLNGETERRNYSFDEVKYSAYREAALSFVEERIETYNPVGMQYLFAPDRRREAAELEFGLDWFDGKGEFERILKAAGHKARPNQTDEQIRRAACELIREMGAYPDRSIIAGYEADPQERKLADYVVAIAIEEVICSKSR